MDGADRTVDNALAAIDAIFGFVVNRLGLSGKALARGFTEINSLAIRTNFRADAAIYAFSAVKFHKTLAMKLKNTEYELNMFARYIDTGDVEYLARLERTVENYRAAAENAAQLTVPADAVVHHIRVLNALSEFAATLDGLKDNAGDPFASVALLRTYNTAEQNVYLSFDALARYARNKQS